MKRQKTYETGLEKPLVGCKKRSWRGYSSAGLCKQRLGQRMTNYPKAVDGALFDNRGFH
jgi:hypothetical protein